METRNISDKDFQHLIVADRISKSSLAYKRKVGAVIVNDDTGMILSHGRNFNQLNDECENSENQTFEHVVHAEEDAIFSMFQNYPNKDIFKIPKTIYVTYSPCMNCCKLIAHAGIGQVVYINEHPTNFNQANVDDGLSPKEYLLRMGINIIKSNVCIYTGKLKTKKKIALVYHSADVDGLMCGYLFKEKFRRESDKYDYTLVPYNYQPELQIEEFDEYHFGDITPPLNWVQANLSKIEDGSIKIRIYDHHADRIDGIRRLTNKIEFITPQYKNQSGAYLMYNHKDYNRFKSSIFDQIIDYISIFDTWFFGTNHEYVAFNEYMLMFKDLNSFSKKIEEIKDGKLSIDEVINFGNILIDKLKADNRKIIENGYYHEESGIFISQGYYNYFLPIQFEEIYKKVPNYFVLYRIDTLNMIVKCSVRTTKEKLTVTEIVKKFCGGGHPKAGGFTISVEAFQMYMKSPELLLRKNN